MNKDTEKIYGIITRGVGGLYSVRISDKSSPNSVFGREVLCRARGIFRHGQLTPTVGDDVIVIPADGSVDVSDMPFSDESDENPTDSHAEKSGRNQSRGLTERDYRLKKNKKDVQVDYVIDEILPRRSLMIRPAAANLDYLFAVIPAASPEPDLLTADKLTVIAENYGITSVVIINKADINREKAESIADIYKTAGYKTFTLSASSGEGVGDLRDYITSLTQTGEANSHVSGAFAGVSGAGKSTLMTALFPDLHLATGKISRKTERGRHTTRHVELYPLNLGEGTFWLADTPGFSMLDFTRFDFFPYDELAQSFREFADCIGKCRYTKCTHLCEDGCAVIAKMQSGGIAASRHESYKKIYEEQRSVPEWKRR